SRSPGQWPRCGEVRSPPGRRGRIAATPIVDARSTPLKEVMVPGLVKHRRTVLSVIVAAVAASGGVRAGGGDGGPGAPDFDRTVAPILARRCLGCHVAPEPKGGLDLSHRRAALRGGESGAVIV